MHSAYSSHLPPKTAWLTALESWLVLICGHIIWSLEWESWWPKRGRQHRHHIIWRTRCQAGCQDGPFSWPSNITETFWTRLRTRSAASSAPAERRRPISAGSSATSISTADGTRSVWGSSRWRPSWHTCWQRGTSPVLAENTHPPESRQWRMSFSQAASIQDAFPRVLYKALTGSLLLVYPIRSDSTYCLAENSVGWEYSARTGLFADAHALGICPIRV